MVARAKSVVPPHRFEYDPKLSAGDPLRQKWCSRCGMPGKPGKGRHRVVSTPPRPRRRSGPWRRVDVDAARALDARRIGEAVDE